MALNEAASREINEGIEQAHQGDPPGRRMTITCECALKSCDRLIEITMPEYQEVRSDATQFAIVPEHFIGDIERIVVRERPLRRGGQAAGHPGRRRDRTDPRS